MEESTMNADLFREVGIESFLIQELARHSNVSSIKRYKAYTRKSYY